MSRYAEFLRSDVTDSLFDRCQIPTRSVSRHDDRSLLVTLSHTARATFDGIEQVGAVVPYFLRFRFLEAVLGATAPSGRRPFPNFFDGRFSFP